MEGGGRKGGRKLTSSANVLSVEHTSSSTLEPSSRLGWEGGGGGGKEKEV